MELKIKIGVCLNHTEQELPAQTHYWGSSQGFYKDYSYLCEHVRPEKSFLN